MSDDKSEFKKTLLFLSVDLIGSTQTKVEFPPGGAEESWLYGYEQFYVTFPEELDKACGEQGIGTPEVWKYNGDEILFRTIVRTATETTKSIVAFQKASNRYMRYQESPRELANIKCAAWLATFPYPNEIVTVPQPVSRLKYERNDDRYGDQIEDYLGPEIDIGFRISKYATSHKLVVSVTLAWVIAYRLKQYKGNLPNSDPPPPPDSYFETWEPLRGVLGGTAYPIIWVDVSTQERELHEKLRGYPRTPSEPDDIIRYCREFISNHQTSIAPPILDDLLDVQNESDFLDFSTSIRKRVNRLDENRAASVEPEESDDLSESISTKDPIEAESDADSVSAD